MFFCCMDATGYARRKSMEEDTGCGGCTLFASPVPLAGRISAKSYLVLEPCWPHVDLGEEQLRKKSQLKSLAVDFFSRAQQGIILPIRNGLARREQDCVFLLDKHFRYISLHWGDGSQHTLFLSELLEPRRGQDVSRSFPDVREPDMCVLIGSATDAQSFLCYFPLKTEADDFFTCVSILRLTVRFAKQNEQHPEAASLHTPSLR
mmetsp:Transcript_80434/g.225715  ORF Transcript_80434/g.225715 Transcript_80434/m.225715 type:complete len:205 (-) Transcript_80434:129-743(-)|eukprot:CAMPEP_0176211510 /NCGR_PEP_ID=MMETSP0121_2-20121125/14688_1 /TAXON_ID=160619 /ORGANISM="Kryptoperidinium foliaceum, Strain CCMP 1326" /LENGTH=204 /DNA_ID=CAMNT_0017550559 /DNA_START=45 /DNA_END=659 /DNA_ORIENTATION=-